MSIKFESLNIIPRPKEIIPKWVNFAIGGSFAIALIMVWLFAFYYYGALSWDSKSKAKESDYLMLNTKENKEVEEKVSEISKKLESFSLAFASRKSSYNFFDFIRNICHPNVSFSNLSLIVKTGNISLTGQADSYQSLSEQVIILKDLKNISNLLISDVSLNKEGSVSFKVSFIYQ